MIDFSSCVGGEARAVLAAELAWAKVEASEGRSSAGPPGATGLSACGMCGVGPSRDSGPGTSRSGHLQLVN